MPLLDYIFLVALRGQDILKTTKPIFLNVEFAVHNVLNCGTHSCLQEWSIRLMQ